MMGIAGGRSGGHHQESRIAQVRVSGMFYAYAADDPLKFVDPEGLDWRKWGRAFVLAMKLLIPSKNVIKHPPPPPNQMQKRTKSKRATKGKESCGGDNAGGGDGPDASDIFSFLLATPPLVENPYELAKEEPDVHDFIFGADQARFY